MFKKTKFVGFFLKKIKKKLFLMLACTAPWILFGPAKSVVLFFSLKSQGMPYATCLMTCCCVWLEVSMVLFS